jgi:hypothetical protein
MMHSRSMGGGRRLALIGAIVVIVGCVLPWYAVGGGAGEMPARTLMAWQHPQGIGALLSALATLALIALPYAMSPRQVALDRGLAFGLPAIIAIVSLVAWVVEVRPAPQGLLPTGAYGFWIAAAGAVMLGRAAFEISREPPRR